MTATARDFWDDQAGHFDDEPDHGLADPAVRAAWRRLLVATVAEPAAAVLDLGCGTGSLSLLLAAEGHRVTGLDLAPKMIARAETKARSAGLAARFLVGDATDPAPTLGEANRGYQVVLARHLLWALPDPAAALDRWLRLLNPAGRLVLIEGRWHTGAGLPMAQVLALVHERCTDVTAAELTDPGLWGGPITDQRYLITARPGAVRCGAVR